MTGSQRDEPTALRLGEEWVQAIIEKDFQRLSELCQPDVRSQMLTPHHIYTFENVPDLIQKVEQWFGACEPIQKEQSRVALVGDQLAVFYRLSVKEKGEPFTVEQQLYCSVRNWQIAHLRLLCSGFQPVLPTLEAPITQPAAASPHLKADALLSINTGSRQESTCALLTPAIKRKLNDISSGQVLEVRVDDPAALEDIQAWCRLSGNTLLNLDLTEGQELHFYLMKK